MSQDEIRTLLDDCVEREERLSEWERTFVDSIGRQVNEGKTLTTKQVDRLSEIWERVTASGHVRR